MLLFKTLIFFVELIKSVFCSSGAVVKTSLEVTHIAWFRVSHAPSRIDLGIVEFGLFGKMYPKIVRNFVELANVTKIGAGYRGTRIFTASEAIMGGYFKEVLCTIYGRHYKYLDAAFEPIGPGWLSPYSTALDEPLFTAMFLVTMAPGIRSSGHTCGKVVRGMAVIEIIRSQISKENYTKNAQINSRDYSAFHSKLGLYISDCGVKIPHKKFYITTDSAPRFR